YLKINRTILDLKDHIICKHSVQRSKIVISRFCSVCLLVSPVLLAVVYKAPPDNSSSIRLYGFCQHISPICMVSSIGKRSGTAFGICFHQKSPQIGISSNSSLAFSFHHCLTWESSGSLSARPSIVIGAAKSI